MDSPVLVRPAGNGPEGETGTTVRYQKTGGFLKPEGALIPPPKDAVQHRMGVEVHLQFVRFLPFLPALRAFRAFGVLPGFVLDRAAAGFLYINARAKLIPIL